MEPRPCDGEQICATPDDEVPGVKTRSEMLRTEEHTEPAENQANEPRESSKSLNPSPRTRPLQDFKYDALVPEKKQIRLLTILCEGTEPDDNIQCTLATYSLCQAPPYQAVSYVWGTAGQDEQIVCSGKGLDITETLRVLLSDVRDQHRTGRETHYHVNPLGVPWAAEMNLFSPAEFLWIDQICIDQNNLAERAEQVKIMSTVYERAEKVLVSLGKDFNPLADLVSTLVLDIGRVDHSFEFPPRPPNPHFPRDEVLSDLGLPCRAHGSWSAFNKTMRLPYFQRVWVVQEVFVAREALIIFDAGVLSWDLFLVASLWLSRNDYQVPDSLYGHYHPGITVPRHLWLYDKSVRGHRRQSLYRTVQTARDVLHSKEPRDKMLSVAMTVLPQAWAILKPGNDNLQLFILQGAVSSGSTVPDLPSIKDNNLIQM